MNENKSLLTWLGEAVDGYRAERQRAQSQRPHSQPSNLRQILSWFVPNGGTLLLIAVLLFTQNVWARPAAAPAAPGPSATTVNYQGRLADPSGTPLDGSYGMSFSLWDAATDGNLVWRPENHTAVPVSDGLFSVGLGSQTSGGIPTTTWDGDRYLEITVGGETLEPRELIRSVPIAGMALTALTVPDGAIGTDQIADGAVTSSKVAPTVFSVYSSGAVPIDSGSTEVLTLNVDFALDATYVIFVRTNSTHDSGGRVITYLADESDQILEGSEYHVYCTQPGNVGTNAGSVSLVHDFDAGAHTIKLKAGSSGTGSTGSVRSAHIIAIPFAQAP